METKKKLNIFVWIGFALDLLGVAIALFLNFALGLSLVVIGLGFSLFGLYLCIKRSGDVKTAVFYVVADVVFLIYLVAFF